MVPWDEIRDLPWFETFMDHVRTCVLSSNNQNSKGKKKLGGHAFNVAVNLYKKERNVELLEAEKIVSVAVNALYVHYISNFDRNFRELIFALSETQLGVPDNGIAQHLFDKTANAGKFLNISPKMIKSYVIGEFIITIKKRTYMMTADTWIHDMMREHVWNDDLFDKIESLFDSLITIKEEKET